MLLGVMNCALSDRRRDNGNLKGIYGCDAGITMDTTAP